MGTRIEWIRDEVGKADRSSNVAAVIAVAEIVQRRRAGVPDKVTVAEMPLSQGAVSSAKMVVESWCVAIGEDFPRNVGKGRTSSNVDEYARRLTDKMVEDGISIRDVVGVIMDPASTREALTEVAAKVNLAECAVYMRRPDDQGGEQGRTQDVFQHIVECVDQADADRVAAILAEHGLTFRQRKVARKV